MAMSLALSMSILDHRNCGQRSNGRRGRRSHHSGVDERGPAAQTLGGYRQDTGWRVRLGKRSEGKIRTAVGGYGQDSSLERVLWFSPPGLLPVWSPLGFGV